MARKLGQIIEVASRQGRNALQSLKHQKEASTQGPSAAPGAANLIACFTVQTLSLISTIMRLAREVCNGLLSGQGCCP
jgi:hypothetical protein